MTEHVVKTISKSF